MIIKILLCLLMFSTACSTGARPEQPKPSSEPEMGVETDEVEDGIQVQETNLGQTLTLVGQSLGLRRENGTVTPDVTANVTVSDLIDPAPPAPGLMPDLGKRYVTFNILIHNTGGTVYYGHPWVGVQLYTATDEQYTADQGLKGANCQQFGGGAAPTTILAGGSARGCVLFTVPQDAVLDRVVMDFSQGMFGMTSSIGVWHLR